ncbi:MAG: LCP family protein, partial [Corynebacterium casei]
MTFSGRDPHRESRRAGASRSVNGPSANQPANDPSRYVLGADGKPLRDRYGRPVMRRESGQRPAQRPPRRTPRTDGRQEPSAGTFRAQPDQTRFDIGPRGN